MPYTAAEFLEIFPTWLEGPFDGAEQMVRDASARVGVGCLCNTNALQWDGMISHWPLSALFEHRFLSFDLGAVKPDPEIYALVVERLPVPPGRVLFLDDNPLNVEGAHAAGLRAEQADRRRGRTRGADPLRIAGLALPALLVAGLRRQPSRGDLPAASTQAMNTAWNGSLSFSDRAPPGIFGYCSGCWAMCRFAGKIASSVATSHQRARPRVAGTIRPTPPAASATPLM